MFRHTVDKNNHPWIDILRTVILNKKNYLFYTRMSFKNTNFRKIF